MSSHWTSIGDTLKPKRQPTPLEQEAIGEVYELARRFAAGDSLVEEIRAATSPRQRRLAAEFTGADHADFAALMLMLDALTRSEPGVIVTATGVLADEELGNARITRENGRDVVAFPIRTPWRIKPDENGEGGVRGEPIYRSERERGPEYGEFRVSTGEIVTKQREPEWWETE